MRDYKKKSYWDPVPERGPKPGVENLLRLLSPGGRGEYLAYLTMGCWALLGIAGHCWAFSYCKSIFLACPATPAKPLIIFVGRLEFLGVVGGVTIAGFAIVVHRCQTATTMHHCC